MLVYMKLDKDTKFRKAQSSLELLITLSFGLIILLPIIVMAFIQMSTSSSTLSATAAQQVASKIATVATLVGSQGYPAKQLTTIDIPPGIQNIYVGTLSNGVGHEIILTILTSGGVDDILTYSSASVSGNIGAMSAPGTYLLNISAENSCPSDTAVPCVYIQSVYT